MQMNKTSFLGEHHLIESCAAQSAVIIIWDHEAWDSGGMVKSLQASENPQSLLIHYIISHMLIG